MDHEKSPLRILLSDDEISILDLYESILSVDGHTPGPPEGQERRLAAFYEGKEVLPDLRCFATTRCQQGDEAVQEVARSIQESTPFAMAFLDIRMPPGPDGIWAAAEIRKIDPLINIVMVTAYPDMPPRDVARRVPPLGRFLLLQKPLLPMEIMQVAAVMADKWRAERRLAL
jgi:CheY-like chemotaxis protein